MGSAEFANDFETPFALVLAFKLEEIELQLAVVAVFVQIAFIDFLRDDFGDEIVLIEHKV